MSIPPLVCSTPPPPDQCEDDKDPGDYDLSYSLSQEDDDDENNGYNYGNFSSYSTFQSTPDNKPLEIQEQEITTSFKNETPKEVFVKYDSEKESEPNNVVHNVFETSDINENKLKCDEDMNIEDLNLKVDEEIESIIASNSVQLETSEPNIVIAKDFDIPHSSYNESPTCDSINLSALDVNPIDTSYPLQELNTDFISQIADSNEEVINVEVDINDTDDILQDDVRSSVNESSIIEKIEETIITSETDPQMLSESNNYCETKSEHQIDTNDDFGDFDDFQSVNSKSNITSIVDKSENPWVNDEFNEFEFGNFAVNFENKFTGEDNLTLQSESVSNQLNNSSQLNNEIKDTDNQLEDDDFGDFDDFKSTTIKAEVNEIIEDPSHSIHDELAVLNLQSTENEHQILESIANVLSSVFVEEVTEPESEFEGKLESLLSETWGHLMETDERQPYIVNWNNSLGQKTLLRALCIDSRNILFGPKWSSNMPKYAANLGNAPLQPQKQASVSSSILTQNEIVVEKSTSKPTTWNDPFTSGGQESCSTENESGAITSGPTDLDVFEGAASTKSDKIYSNTMGVQPMRQINLPDTHIFTPTDSEIPRSKTIHYDRAPTVLLPQATIDVNNQIDTIKSLNTTNALENSVDDNEYLDFQNFKGTSDISQPVVPKENNFETAVTVNALPKQNIAYQTELLQPIRVEHTMPTLNWPDPGEVKEAFDDFSDFVSMTSQPTAETRDSRSTLPTESRLENVNINKLDSFSDLTEKTDVAAEIGKPDLDDDFNTFQSAQPSKIESIAFKGNIPENSTNQIPPSHVTEFDNASPKLDRMKSDTISFGSVTRSNEGLSQNISIFSNKTEQANKISLSTNTQMPTNLLQPTPASFSAANLQSQQKSTQILQPLSLESYSQINWPSPGIDLQDLSRFNPVETLHSLKSDLSVSGLNKTASPIHTAKNAIVNHGPDDDVWGEFVSSKPKQQQSQPKKPSAFGDDDEWTDFISSTSVKPINGLNTISLNVHTNSNIQKSVQNKYGKKSNQPPLDIPTLNYITPKSNPHMSYNDKHFQNL